MLDENGRRRVRLADNAVIRCVGGSKQRGQCACECMSVCMCVRYSRAVRVCMCYSRALLKMCLQMTLVTRCAAGPGPLLCVWMCVCVCVMVKYSD